MFHAQQQKEIDRMAKEPHHSSSVESEDHEQSTALARQEDTQPSIHEGTHAQPGTRAWWDDEDDDHTAGAPPDLDHDELHDVEERIPPRAAVVYETIRRQGEEELHRPGWALAWSGLAAGLSMGFSLMTEGLLRQGLPDAPWERLVSALGYCVGFLIVILGRQQLFTENTLTPILPLLARPRLKTLLRVLRLWGIVLAANLTGALLFALAVGTTDVFEPELKQVFAEIGKSVVSYGFGTTLMRAIFAGWLIALMVWLLPLAETARVWVIIIITYIVGLAHLSHSIAGSLEAFYAAIVGVTTWSQVLFGFVVPTVIGNIIGGVALVALINYAQVFSGAHKAAQHPSGYVAR